MKRPASEKSSLSFAFIRVLRVLRGSIFFFADGNAKAEARRRRA